MRPALDPANALGLIALLSVDVTRSIVTDEAGNTLAGNEDLHSMVTADTPVGWSENVYVARSGRFVIGVEAGSRALRELVRVDVETALSAMA